MDFQELLLAVGRGVVKLITALFIGVGVGLVTIGYKAMQSGVPMDFRHSPPPLGETFLGVGAGLLAAGASRVVAFFGPGARRPIVPPDPRRREAGAYLGPAAFDAR